MSIKKILFSLFVGFIFLIAILLFRTLANDHRGDVFVAPGLTIAATDSRKYEIMARMKE